MLENEYTYKVAQACRNNEVYGLADKNTRRRNDKADPVTQTLQDETVSPAPEQPCSQADPYTYDRIYRYDVMKGFKQVIPDPQKHVGNNTESDNRRYDDCANFSIHESATITSGLRIPSQKHRLFLLSSLFPHASEQEIRG